MFITGILTQTLQTDVIISWMEHELANNFSTIYKHLEICLNGSAFLK